MSSKQLGRAAWMLRLDDLSPPASGESNRSWQTSRLTHLARPDAPCWGHAQQLCPSSELSKDVHRRL